MSPVPGEGAEGDSQASETGRHRPRDSKLLEDAVLLAEVVNDLGLLSIDPAGEARQEELEVEGVGFHAPDCGDQPGAVSPGLDGRSSFRTLRGRNSRRGVESGI